MNTRPTGDTAFLQQTQALVTEVHAQRNEIEALQNMNGLLRQQYDELAARHAETLKRHEAETRELRTKHETALHEAITARDVAERSAEETNTILQRAARDIMQGMRAMRGDEVEPVKIVAQTGEAHLRPETRKLLDGTLS